MDDVLYDIEVGSLEETKDDVLNILHFAVDTSHGGVDALSLHIFEHTSHHDIAVLTIGRS